jgi:hypothetical protein
MYMPFGSYSSSSDQSIFPQSPTSSGPKLSRNASATSKTSSTASVADTDVVIVPSVPDDKVIYIFLFVC